MTQAWWPPVIHARDRRTPTQRLATTQTSRCTSLLSVRCSAQHAYIIACCHVITSDYLIGTVSLILTPSDNPAIFAKEVCTSTPFIIPEINKRTCTNSPRSIIKYSRIKLLNSRPKRWGSINHSKLVFLFKNTGFQEQRPRLVAISKVLSKLKKICIIFMVKINNFQTFILKGRTNRILTVAIPFFWISPAQINFDTITQLA